MREQYIRRQARRLGLDPAAVLAVASAEGLSGGVGDGGHAFGPFQMNDAGGVLTNAPGYQHSNQYAWSNQGINRALSSIAQVAKGLHGRAAVSAIVSRFERPADPTGEIQRATAALSRFGTFKGTMGPSHPGKFVNVGGGRQFDPTTYRKQAAALMVQNAVQTAQGGQPVDIPASLLALKQSATVAAPGTSGAPKIGSGGTAFGDALVKAASKQLGQPYVWGGESRKEGGFDCSGLVQWAAASLGVNLPRTAAEQGKAGRAVGYGQLKPGDLLVENNGQHVVMYAGNGRVIAAPHTGTDVQYQPLSYFPQGQYSARRIRG